jgi:hypothetical protein
MVYSEVVTNGLILKRKVLYTFADVNKVMVNSLFNNEASTLTRCEAVFVIKCSAIYHGTDYSQPIRRYSALNGIYTMISSAT